MESNDHKINSLEKNVKEEDKNSELFYNEYKWKTSKDNITYFFFF